MIAENKKILKNIKSVYFIGIGGIGMSALALYFKKNGKYVAGYDKTPSIITDKLRKNNIKIHFDDNINLIPEKILNEKKENIIIVYTPAIPDTHSELKHFISQKYKVLKRAETLGIITAENKVVAVAGTHGKTSVSVIISHIFKTAEISFNAFLGGISKNYESNFILNEKENTPPFAVVEADEYDKSFLNLFPETTLVTAVDEDHLDIYKDINDLKKNFEIFISQTAKNGNLIIKNNVKLNSEKFPENVFTYSLNQKADFYAENIFTDNQKSRFDLVTPEEIIKNITIKIPGELNIENAVAAAAAAYVNKIPASEIKKALYSWQGVKRRFEYIIKNNDLIYIDDYAHHPEELSYFINSVKKIYPDKKILIIFQPHLYTRTRDFAENFAESLNLCDKIILTDIYPAREKTLPGVSSKLIFDKIKNPDKKLIKKEEILNLIKKEKNTVYITAGAGDIDRYPDKIKEKLLK